VTSSCPFDLTTISSASLPTEKWKKGVAVIWFPEDPPFDGLAFSD